ncbi:peptidase inhibitor family I36 protein [Nonomuraea sp. B10E15]|uniref:peptidase inhibitor family I36 protein n=1 Tax=Nonomuraea sp. B10E15 TaxID=3153560 RepID=UPI00325E662B
MRVERKVALAVTAATTVAVLFAGGTPAAADSFGKCSAGWVCLYENEDFNQDKGLDGDHWRNFKKSKPDLRKYNWLDAHGWDSGDGMDNETSSIKVRKGWCWVQLYQDVGYGGAMSVFGRGVGQPEDGKLKNDEIGDNRASAFKIVNC